MVWFAPDKTPQQAHADYADCELQAAHVNNYGAEMGGIIHRSRNEAHLREFMDHCMLGKGYQLVNVTNLPNGAAYPKP